MLIITLSPIAILCVIVLGLTIFALYHREGNWMNIKRIRELIGYLVSAATMWDPEATQQFTDELDELLPPIGYHDVDEFYREEKSTWQNWKTMI